MTYNDIYKNFLIEYDKADVSSSYPSLTNEEIAAILNKAMHALIAQKVTGNNPRKVALDMDSKAMADIAPLIKTWIFSRSTNINDKSTARNEFVYEYDNTANDITVTPPAYILGGKIIYNNALEETVQLLTSVIADKFKETAHNKPWLKEPIMYVQQPSQTSNNPICIHILIDSRNVPIPGHNEIITGSTLYIRGVTMPKAFDDTFSSEIKFPLSDTMCEELINLAVIFACRNVQDPRLATIVQTKSLEA